MAKVSTQLLIEQPMKDRVVALAVVRGEAQAETLRTLVDKALPLLETTHGRELAELRDDFERLGLAGHTGDALEYMLRNGISAQAVKLMDRFPVEFPDGAPVG